VAELLPRSNIVQILEVGFCRMRLLHNVPIPQDESCWSGREFGVSIVVGRALFRAHSGASRAFHSRKSPVVSEAGSIDQN
jgi:hypothetical protein